MSAPRREPPGWLPPVAGALGEALARLHGLSPDPVLAQLVSALTLALERGEVELDLAGPPPPGVEAAAWPGRHRAALEASPLAAEPDGPLALEGDRLLWRRWQRRRRAVLAALLERVTPLPPGERPAGPPPLPAHLDGRQRQAVHAVLRHRLVLLEGGPGTGKTSTVAAMLAAVREQRPEARLHLAAPTGKAAARLRAATGGDWPCTTLHRLLESRGERFGRGRRRPLALDLLVVDEVSMVDLTLMEALLEALPDPCRLVLVGDPAQLPPIAPGPVLLELQRPDLRRRLGAAAVTLTTPYRNAGPIAAAAALLREGIGEDPAPAGEDPLAPLCGRLAPADGAGPLVRETAPPRTPPRRVLERLAEHRRRLAALAERCRPQGGADDDAWRELLAERDALLVLSPVRRGPWGLEALHRAVLGEAATAGPGGWPAGTPVLCTRNLPELGLANGDVGVLVRAAGAEAVPWVLFGDPGAEAPLRVHPAQLAGAAEPAFALTVHKAQGSEAEEVLVLLPEGERLDRRLLYTALTRARRRVLLVTPPPSANER
ncbi:MAG: AAA family ATPase [Synechococcaceae cyanobacterium]|nr:AAA family ATPase [Synechococcaceae cyanobacterium]